MWDKNIHLASDIMFQDIFSFCKEKEGEGSLENMHVCYFCNKFLIHFFFFSRENSETCRADCGSEMAS